MILLVKKHPVDFSFPDVKNSLEVRLPRLRNTVNIFADDASKKGLIATVRLDKAGFTKNLQRGFGRDYTVLHVKGGKLDPPY